MPRIVRGRSSKTSLFLLILLLIVIDYVNGTNKSVVNGKNVFKKDESAASEDKKITENLRKFKCKFLFKLPHNI